MLADPVDAFQGRARQYVARGKMMGCFPAHDSTYIFYYLPAGRFEELRSLGLSRFKGGLAGIEPELSGALNNIQSWDDLAYAVPTRVDSANWVADNVALLGDAVHALNPSWAQGANLALQDATKLADTIETCFESRNYSAPILKTYESARRKQVEFVQRQADRTARIMDTESRFYNWLGKRTLRKAGKNKNLMRLALEASSGLRDHLGFFDQLRFML